MLTPKQMQTSSCGFRKNLWSQDANFGNGPIDTWNLPPTAGLRRFKLLASEASTLDTTLENSQDVFVRVEETL